MNNMHAYSHWPLVAVNSLVFLIFVVSFSRPPIPSGLANIRHFLGLVCLQGLLEGGDGYEAFYGAQSSSLWRGTLTPVLGKTLNCPFNWQGGT